MKKKIKQNIPSFLVLIMQFCTYPYVFYILFGLPSDTIMYGLFFLIISICLFVSKSKHLSLPLSVKMLMIIQGCVWLVYYVIFKDSSYLTRIFFIVLTYITIVYLYRNNNLFRYTKMYDIALTIQGVLGIFGFVLVFIGLLHPLMIHQYSETRYLNWYGITCSNAVVGNFIRVGGFFDEPGALAFWGIFALLFNKIFFDNKKLEYLLIISLLFTFSAAYFVLLPIYFICFYLTNAKKLFKTLLIVIPIMVAVYHALSSNYYFLYMTTERFQGGEIRSTRYYQSEHTKKLFLKSPIFGVGAKNLEEDTETTDNPYEIFAKDGLVGFTVTYLPLIYLIVKFYKRKEILFSIAILFADYLQRPFHINEMHFFILYLFVSLIILKYDNKKRKIPLNHEYSHNFNLLQS